ncbi:MAG: DUF5131 family protein [Candidatus Zixiibacteriota bacterium]
MRASRVRGTLPQGGSTAILTEIPHRCIDQHVPFFFKQWGGVHKRRHGRKLDGRTWDEMPTPKRRWVSQRVTRPVLRAD